MKFTLTPQYHEMTIHFTLEGMELRFENPSGDTWVVVFGPTTYDVLVDTILACHGSSSVEEPKTMLGTQQEIPF